MLLKIHYQGQSFLVHHAESFIGSPAYQMVSNLSPCMHPAQNSICHNHFTECHMLNIPLVIMT